MDPCTITKAAREQLSSLGADIKNLNQKLDLLAKQANQEMDLLGMPLATQLLKDFTDAVGATATGAISQMTQQLAASLNQGISLVGGILSLIVMVASAGTQVQLLFVSELRRELSVRIVIFRLLQSHYANILRILKLLQAPRSATFKKLLVALPYVRRAESQLNKVVLSEASGGLPARYSYKALQNAFLNIEQATRVLSSDASKGGTELGKALTATISGGTVTKKRWETIGQAIAKDLVFKSIAQSLSYIEYLTWNYMRIASLLPIPFEVSDSIFQPNNYTAQLLKNNNVTGVNIQRFDQTAQDRALADLRDAMLDRENDTLLKTSTRVIQDVDLLKGIIPTNIIINSLIDTIINFPTFNLDLQIATVNLMATILPIRDSVQSVREDMEQSQQNQDTDIVLAGKEGIWLTKLNTIMMLKNGILPVYEGQTRIDTDKQNLERLIAFLQDNEGIFVLAEKMPKVIVQSLQLLRAPFNRRSLEESVVITSFILKQLEKAIQVDRKVLSYTLNISDPLTQFKELLLAAQQLPPPMSTVANALMTGQAQQVLGFISSLTLGTLDTIKSLFNPACPEVKPKEELELAGFDGLNDIIDKQQGIGVGTNMFA